MRRRYGVVISAAVLAMQLAGYAGAQVAPDLEELETISALLDANDVEGLRAYLALNADLLQGDSELARLLREYMEQTEDVAAFLGIAEGEAGLGNGDGVAAPAAEGPGFPVASLY